MYSKDGTRFRFCLSLRKLNQNMVPFVIITEVRNFFDARPGSFQIQNGGCVIRVCYGLSWQFSQS